MGSFIAHKIARNSCSTLKIRVKHTKCHAFGGDNIFIIHKSFGLILTPQKCAHVNQLKHSVIYVIKIYDFEWGTRIKNKNYVHVYHIARFSSQFRILFCLKKSQSGWWKIRSDKNTRANQTFPNTNVVLIFMTIEFSLKLETNERPKLGKYIKML